MFLESRSLISICNSCYDIINGKEIKLEELLEDYDHRQEAYKTASISRSDTLSLGTRTIIIESANVVHTQ